MEIENRRNGKPLPGLTRNLVTFISEEEFRRLADLVHREFGIVLKGDRRLTLHTKLSHRLGLLGLSSYSEYLDMLGENSARGDPKARGELNALAAEIMNNETFFQREKNQFEAFFVFLNDIKRRKVAGGESSINIISAGCSTGEEIYSLSILLFESALFAWGNWETGLTGIDVDKSALRKARKALYSNNSFRLLNEEDAFVNKYFHREESGFRLKRAYKSPVKFRHGNLMDPAAFDGLEGADAIFCRNVFIYMSDEAISNIARNFHSCLRDEGYLFVGSTETLIQKTDLFVPECREGIVVYRKAP